MSTLDELSGLVKTHFTKQHVFSLKKEEHCNYLVKRWFGEEQGEREEKETSRFSQDIGSAQREN